MSNQIDVVTTWDEFRRKWDARQNFILRGEVFPFKFDSPPLETIVDTLRRNPATRILHDVKDDVRLLNTFDDLREMPLEEAMEQKVNIAHFEVLDFAGPGELFEPLAPIYQAWYDSLHDHGFTFTSTQRAIFYSNANCRTGYHFDSSYVLAWQLTGVKRFCWLKEPERWCGHDVLLDQADYYDKMKRPDGITKDDIIECEMHPGDVLWNVMLTPHWVYALDANTYSLNITHFQLHCDGRASAIEQEHAQLNQERAALAA